MFDKLKCLVGWHSPELKVERGCKVSFDVLRFPSGLMEPYTKEREAQAVKRYTSTPETTLDKKYYRCRYCMKSLGGYVDG